MKSDWLFQNGSDTLVLFFAGWGMDRRPFAHLTSEHDLLMFYDYRDLSLPADIDLEALLDRYATCKLIAWSLGSAVANLVCFPYRDRLATARAINGTVMPADDQCGIPPALFDRTIANLSAEGLARFQRRMFRDAKLVERYQATAPARTLDDIDEELRYLRELPPAQETLFTSAYVGRDDRIISAENQCNGWSRFQVPHEVIDAPHFPFFGWSSWEEMGDGDAD
jgi:biotin synthesis protein BioG